MPPRLTALMIYCSAQRGWRSTVASSPPTDGHPGTPWRRFGAGRNSNNHDLGGLALDVGIIVDTRLVTIENKLGSERGRIVTSAIRMAPTRSCFRRRVPEVHLIASWPCGLAV